jgi:dTDP-D-glucose 4,6-dehydratase
MEVERERLWEGHAPSYTAWIQGMARRADLQESVFWRCLKAGRIYLELTGRDESLIEHVADRPGHDRRYSLSSEKLRTEIGWEPKTPFAAGIERTVEWYRENGWWWEPIRSGEYREYYERQYGRALS